MGELAELAKNTVIDPATERLKGAVTGQFVVAWVILKWRVLVYLFWGSLTPAERITAVHDVLGGNRPWWWWLTQDFIWPAALACLYLFTVPIIRDFYLRWREDWDYRGKQRQFDQEREFAEYQKYGAILSNIVAYLLTEIEENRDVLKAIGVSSKEGASDAEEIALISERLGFGGIARLQERFLANSEAMLLRRHFEADAKFNDGWLARLRRIPRLKEPSSRVFSRIYRPSEQP